MTAVQVKAFQKEEKRIRKRICAFLKANGPLQTDETVIALLWIAASFARDSGHDRETFTETAHSIWNDQTAQRETASL
jgi:hypothetical protein